MLKDRHIWDYQVMAVFFASPFDPPENADYLDAAHSTKQIKGSSKI